MPLLVTDANRARRRRRQTQTVLNSAQPANRNSQVDARQLPLNNLNSQGFQQQQPQQQQFSQSGIGIPKDVGSVQNQGSRQYYPYQSQYGMGSQGSYYNPYGGMGSQYGYGQGSCKTNEVFFR